MKREAQWVEKERESSVNNRRDSDDNRRKGASCRRKEVTAIKSQLPWQRGKRGMGELIVK